MTVRPAHWVAFLMLAASSAAHAQRAMLVSPLAGVKTVHVVIETLDKAGTAAGLTVERLRTVVELKLRQAGVRVVSPDEERASGVTSPTFYVRVGALPLNQAEQFFFFAVDLECDVVSTVDANRAFVMGKAWHDGEQVSAPRQSAQTDVEQAIQQNVDDFLNELLRINPKSP